MVSILRLCIDEAVEEQQQVSFLSQSEQSATVLCHRSIVEALDLALEWDSIHVRKEKIAVEDEAAKRHPTYSPHPRGVFCLPTLLEDLSMHEVSVIVLFVIVVVLFIFPIDFFILCESTVTEIHSRPACNGCNNNENENG